MNDREQIERAANRIARGQSVGLCVAFCDCFDSRAWGESCVADLVPPYLTAMGGTQDADDYFWPTTTQGNNQRPTFLAFMLAWEADQ